MNPRQIFFLHEYYRVVTSALFHANFIHLGMNMISFISLGSSLEKHFGTVWHMFTISWSILLTAAVYLLIAYSLKFVPGMNLMYQDSVGFSGVLFHLSVLQSNLIQNSTRSLFGMMDVPTALYPWALLTTIQVLMPNLSLVGHLSGILVGTLQINGIFDYILPSQKYMRECDEGKFCQRIQTWNIVYSKTLICDSFQIGTGASDKWDVRRKIVRVINCLKESGVSLTAGFWGRGISNRSELISTGIVMEDDEMA